MAASQIDFWRARQLMRHRRRRFVVPSWLLVLPATVFLTFLPGSGGEWARWRGPDQTGVSDETGLISTWSIEGENLLWKVPFIGRSTPVAFDGRVCAIGRAGADATKREVVTCWDAITGKPRWERDFNVYHTAVPFTRAG